MMKVPAANPTDNSTIRYVTKRTEVSGCLKSLNDALQSKSTYQAVVDGDFAPSDRRQRYSYIKGGGERTTGSTSFLTYSSGGSVISFLLLQLGISNHVASQASLEDPGLKVVYLACPHSVNSQKSHTPTLTKACAAILMSFAAYLPHHLKLSLLRKFKISLHLESRSFQQEFHNLKHRI